MDDVVVDVVKRWDEFLMAGSQFSGNGSTSEGDESGVVYPKHWTSNGFHTTGFLPVGDMINNTTASKISDPQPAMRVDRKITAFHDSHRSSISEGVGPILTTQR